MDFEFTEEQRMLKDSVHRFCEKKLPREVIRKSDEEEELPPALWSEMADLGWLGIALPEEFGGTGGTIIEQLIIMEELSRYSPALGICFMTTNSFGARTILNNGSEEQKQAFLPKVSRGKVKFCLALTEPGGGTDVLGALKTTAETEESELVINGQKTFISDASIADYMILVARTDKTPAKKSKGLSLMVVDLKSDGIEVRKLHKLGIRPSTVSEVFLTDVRVPLENLLGRRDEGWYHLLDTLNNERILVAAYAIGIAQSAFEDALRYAKERDAFGRPIGQFQAIQHYLSDMYVQLELARLITYKAAWLQCLGRPCGVESTMAKLVASEAGLEIATNGMRILAGYGYMMEYDMQRYYRDVMQAVVTPITNEMSKNFIGQNLGLGRSY
ncbi:acyl-CoA/acyl-ACP dehydrogenase [Candidatus Bathyarchaeota archaeon]|nr:acyl-CoA/acyl-ACP dehydrogenase [Candidatus Bathyarchaeota archaeon]